MPRGSERELIERVRRLQPGLGPDLVAGIGDDCAIFRPRGAAEDLLFTTDFLIENVHFRRDTHAPEAVGHKCLARGLSDIAAMGGVPRFCLLSLALPSSVDDQWVDRFYRGLLRLARRSGAVLAGGDLARHDVIAADIVVCGAVPVGRAVRRDGARVGDGVWVSGTLGGSALGLRQMRGRAGRRHRFPQPRLALAEPLRTLWRATAAMDVSDGLSLDLPRLCRASGVAASLEDVPVFAGASEQDALHGGEDYELLFTAPVDAPVPGRFGSVRLTRIGVVVTGEPGAVTLRGVPLPALGYDHLRGRAGP